MIEKYRYRPPFKHLIIGFLFLILSYIFGSAINFKIIWFSILMAFFLLMTLGLGIAFLTLFISKFGGGKLIIGDNFIEIPGRWKNRTRLKFDEITDIGEIDTYDNVIEIESEQGFFIIERNWMKRQDFDSAKKKLKEYWISK
jgi:hypothetical protein